MCIGIVIIRNSILYETNENPNLNFINDNQVLFVRLCYMPRVDGGQNI